MRFIAVFEKSSIKIFTISHIFLKNTLSDFLTKKNFEIILNVTIIHHTNQTNHNKKLFNSVKP